MGARTARTPIARPALPTSPLHRAKLRAPATSVHYVHRPRLTSLLDAATTTPLTVICAPAGAGKTTLAAGWVAQAPVMTTWLALDSGDRDVGQFWLSLIASLQAVAPSCGQRTAAGLKRGASADEALDELLDDLESGEHATAVLVIDDFHLLDDDPSITSSVALFAQHLPDWLHLVLLSRRAPDLPRERLQARGQLGEIHFAELRFSLSEARQLLSRLDSALPDEQIDAIAARAEGWAAGLQLAALAARSERAQDSLEVVARGEGVLVQDYVLREVLAAESPTMLEALFALAVVKRVNPGLARALTGRADADELLNLAESRGLFVTRLDVAGWFEIHSLVRAALLADLESRAPGRAAEQHARAAQWFEQAGEVPLALEHWVDAGRHRDALRLLFAEHANLDDSGRACIINRTVAAIPPDVATADLEAMVEYACCHVLVNRRRYLQLAGEAVWAGRASRPNKVTRARLRMLGAIAATITGAWTEGGDLARQAMTDLGESAWQDALGRQGWNVIARAIALSERWDESDDEVRRAVLALGRDPRQRLAFEGTRAVGEALAGRPVDALRVVGGVRHAAEVANLSVLRAELALAEAMANRELGDRPRALADLAALAEKPVETTLYCRILACLELTQAHLDDGELDRARAGYGEAQSLADGEFVGSNGRDWLARVGVLLALATREVDYARMLSQQIDDPFWGGVSTARVHLAEGNRRDALECLAPLVPRCPRHDVVRGLLAARATDDHDDALRHAARALQQAASAGLLQTVASEGPEVVELAERASSQVPPPWVDRLRRTAGSGTARPARGELIEPLTERERDVLRFLPSRLTVREIADELFVSVNTLKFHLKVIYRKLGVSTREEAAEAARRMSFVPR